MVWHHSLSASPEIPFYELVAQLQVLVEKLKQSLFGFCNESTKINRVRKNRAHTIRNRKGGESGRATLKSKAQRHQPACIDADKLINELSIIIGNCDLLIQNTEPDSEQTRRLVVIRDMADTVRKELVEHQRQVEAEMRKPGTQKAS
jgi:hypothetical protein